MSNTLLIDGDMMAYRIVSADTHEAEFAPDVWGFQTDLGHCKARLLEEVGYLMRELKADNVVMAFSDSVNFRKEVDPMYKSNRKKKPKPVGYKALVDWVEEVATRVHGWTFARMPGLEADDVLGIMTEGPDGDNIIVSGDKDMKTLPCRLVDPEDPALRETLVDERQANFNWMLQTLAGDSTDGYRGCPKVGPVSGSKALKASGEGLESLWATVVALFLKNGQTEEDALRNARLARILRAEDYHPESKVDAHGVLLWHPNMLLTPF